MSGSCVLSHASLGAPAGDNWEVLSQMSEMSADYSIISEIGIDVVSLCDEETASTKKAMLSFKDALLYGAGGPSSARGMAMAKYKNRLPPLARKPHHKASVKDDEFYEEPSLDLEFYARKAHGAKRYRFHASAANTAKMLALIPEEDTTAAAADDDDDDHDDETVGVGGEDEEYNAFFYY